MSTETHERIVARIKAGDTERALEALAIMVEGHDRAIQSATTALEALGRTVKMLAATALKR